MALEKLIAECLIPLEEPGGTGLRALIGGIAERRVVLLGEASHGTSEFYASRAAITRHLIAEHGFTILAVEADWPDAAAVNRYVAGRPNPPEAESPFQRFPQWMWRNTDVLDLIAWLRHHNEGVRDVERKVGFHGLDLYNMSASIAAVLGYLDRTDKDAARVARQRYGCLSPWERDPSVYGRKVLAGYEACENAVIEQCRELHRRAIEEPRSVYDGLFDAQQNARLVASAERYYRTMYRGGAASWNLRDTHMFETLRDLLGSRGPRSKAIVWAHNSHIGDARHTAMGQRMGELNLGQLCRETFGEDAALVGFSTHTGTVAAATEWNGEMEVMRVRPSVNESYERLCHEAGVPAFVLDFRRERRLAEELAAERLERFIGVIYRPETELMSHYMKVCLPSQFDSLVWFDETTAVTPLGPEHHGRAGIPDTFPFGL